jgi:hypothetical protein
METSIARADISCATVTTNLKSLIPLPASVSASSARARITTSLTSTPANASATSVTTAHQEMPTMNKSGIAQHARACANRKFIRPNQKSTCGTWPNATSSAEFKPAQETKSLMLTHVHVYANPWPVPMASNGTKTTANATALHATANAQEASTSTQ